MSGTNIFRSPRGENKIFRDENALLPDYLPGELPGREHEVKELVYCLQPASENRQPEHALLYHVWHQHFPLSARREQNFPR